VKTDPNHESPDIIDRRAPDDPSHWWPRPGDPSVLPGITLPPELERGWTIAADGSVVPPDAPETPVTVLPEITITGTPPSSIGPALLLGAFALALVVAAVKSR
jgi:hypothetical protein